jgi:hypothetical protein
MVIQSRRTSASDAIAIAICIEATVIEGAANTIVKAIHSGITTIRLHKNMSTAKEVSG